MSELDGSGLASWGSVIDGLFGDILSGVTNSIGDAISGLFD
jgi:hypothetical protein